MLIEALRNLGLRNRDQLPDIFGGRLSQVHHDVGVNVRDLRVAVPKPLQSDLIYQAPGADTFDFLEDRTRAWVILEPWVLAAAPAQILLHYPMHDGRISLFQLECDGEGDVPLLVQGAGVIAKMHVVTVDCCPFPIVGQ